MIAFIGSVFSPYYAAARARALARGGTAPAEDFCAVNVALYGDGGKRWAMTERGARHLRRTADTLCIGPSRCSWDGQALRVDLDELTVPWPARLRGRVLLQPAALPGRAWSLSEAGHHAWQPIAPVARVTVALDSPALSWQGRGYLDGNHGDAPLEAHFAGWHWSRAALADGSTLVLYDALRRDGSALEMALAFDAAGAVRRLAVPPALALPPSRWGIDRKTRSAHASVLRTLEDTPFYTRSSIEIEAQGERVEAMHESLSLDRFRAPWVRWMLPFRMPRKR